VVASKLPLLNDIHQSTPPDDGVTRDNE
jgi:hypothetical protein